MTLPVGRNEVFFPEKYTAKIRHPVFEFSKLCNPHPQPSLFYCQVGKIVFPMSYSMLVLFLDNDDQKQVCKLCLVYLEAMSWFKSDEQQNSQFSGSPPIKFVSVKNDSKE